MSVCHLFWSLVINTFYVAKINFYFFPFNIMRLLIQLLVFADFFVNKTSYLIENILELEIFQHILKKITLF